MRALRRRLATLERVVDPPAAEEVVYAVCLNTERGDLARVGRRWVPCDARAILARNWPTKVYLGWIPDLEP